MIASPGDVEQERRIAREVIHDWNDLHSEQSGIVLLPISWETHSSPEMGEHPQAIINKQVLKDADLLVGIFWTRLGTPTGEAESGTVEEIQEHIKADKPAMIYFSKKPVELDSVDQDQYQKLKAFKESTQETGLYHEYNSLGHFKEDLYRHLVMTINKNEYFAKQAEVKELAWDNWTSKAMKATWPTISMEAEDLLKEAVKDANGRIMKIGFMGGTVVQTNGRNFTENKDARTIALWEGAVNELLEAGFIEKRGQKGEVFALTRLGYEYADKLQADDSSEKERFSKEELAVIESLSNGETGKTKISQHTTSKLNCHQVDVDAAIASLKQAGMLRQSRTSPIGYILTDDATVWASKNKNLWMGQD